VVLSSHVISELERVCDYLVALNHGRVQLTGAVEDLLAEHLSVIGPTDAAAALHRTQTVVTSRNTGRQTTALIRRGRNPLDPVWQCEPVRLDDLILAYLNDPQASALPGPQALTMKASS
jgi:ABC-2 type transport system ATP-binding protein